MGKPFPSESLTKKRRSLFSLEIPFQRKSIYIYLEDPFIRSRVKELLGEASDAAVAQYLYLIERGEPQASAAAETLSLYLLLPDNSLPTSPRTSLRFWNPPNERIAILQRQMGVFPSGEYDGATRNKLVSLGVTPP